MTEPVTLPLAEIDQGGASYGERIQAALNHLREAAYDREDLLQFLAFALPRAGQSKAQLFQDLWALWVSGQKRGGYFVEFGAADGVFLSNSWLLETEMAWSGVLAEPNPRFAESLRRHRRCAVSTLCVYSNSGEHIDFLATRVGELSRIADIVPGDDREFKRAVAEKIRVETISLNDLLIKHEAPRQIDFLSIDTEGSEFKILSAFDFDRWDVRAIAVEHNCTPAREQLYELLTAKGYRRQWPDLSNWDDWYVRP